MFRRDQIWAQVAFGWPKQSWFTETENPSPKQHSTLRKVSLPTEADDRPDALAATVTPIRRPTGTSEN